jgi:hypothetical protein
MERLEALVATFVQHTDEAVVELRRGAEESRREMLAFKEEMRAFKGEMAVFKEEVRRDIAGMEQWRIQSQKQWGELAQKLGTFVEDIVAPNIPRVGRELFGLNGQPQELLSAARLRVWHRQDSARMREFDYIYATRKGWIVVESKNDPKLKDIDIFREMLAEVNEFFPEYAPLRLYPVFASLSVPDHVVKYCTRHRIYAMGLAADTMQVLNLAEMSAEAAK